MDARPFGPNLHVFVNAISDSLPAFAYGADPTLRRVMFDAIAVDTYPNDPEAQARAVKEWEDTLV